MNLCFICGKWSETGDGKNLIAILQGLQSAGHTITVILTKDERSPDGFDDIRFFPIGRHGNPVTIFRIQQKLLTRLMQENTFDAVLPFGDSLNIFSLCAKKAIKYPLIFCERSDPEYTPTFGILRSLRNGLYNLATGYIFQNERQKQYFSEKIQQKSYVIPDFIIHPAQQSCAEIPKEHTILCYARLDSRQKNPYMLFDGFIEFAKSYPEYTLKLYGDGEDREKCLEYIQKSGNEWNIKLPGIVEDPEEELKKAEVFVLTSNYEGTPNELLPAMSMGVACICTDCGCASELINNGVNGVLIPTNDPKTLTDALSYLAENEELRKKLGESAFEINKWCIAEKVIPLWELAIKEIIEKRQLNTK